MSLFLHGLGASGGGWDAWQDRTTGTLVDGWHTAVASGVDLPTPVGGDHCTGGSADSAGTRAVGREFPDACCRGEVTVRTELTAENGGRFAARSDKLDRFHPGAGSADQTHREERFGHGVVLLDLINTALTRLPGPPIHLSQELECLTPTGPGATVTTICRVVENVGDETYRLRTCIYNDADELLIDGEALVRIDIPPRLSSDRRPCRYHRRMKRVGDSHYRP